MSTSSRRSSFVTQRGPSSAWAFWLIAALSFGGVATALVSQHVYRMEPCAWCVLQRLIFVVIGAFALVGVAWRRDIGARLASAAVLLLSLAGIGSALWQHMVASKSASCNLTLADRIVSMSGLDKLLPGVFEVRASCADAAVSVFGMSYALWAAALFVLCGIVAIRTLRQAR